MLPRSCIQTAKLQACCCSGAPPASVTEALAHLVAQHALSLDGAAQHAADLDAADPVAASLDKAEHCHTGTSRGCSSPCHASCCCAEHAYVSEPLKADGRACDKSSLLDAEGAAVSADEHVAAPGVAVSADEQVDAALVAAVSAGEQAAYSGTSLLLQPG
eukprot:1158894-Pelagomonas_calceolata.AAC.7